MLTTQNHLSVKSLTHMKKKEGKIRKKNEKLNGTVSIIKWKNRRARKQDWLSETVFQTKLYTGTWDHRPTGNRFYWWKFRYQNKWDWFW